VITLAIDTSDSRGSVAILRDGAVAARQTHEDSSDYSGWLLPAVGKVLAEAGTKIEGVDLLGVSTGPGSFTGLRVGLTTVKAWSEVYGKPVAGISRLEALARSIETKSGWVASLYDAQRGQVFGAVYEVAPNGLIPAGEEMVVSPEEFVLLVEERAGSGHVAWITLDQKLMENLESFRGRIAAGDSIHVCSSELASVIARLAEERAKVGQFSDSLALDANYVRRSDAEIFWKGSPSGVR
jgi:tRNA threonylcarbamoyladenosine biosynthesis protein TsaB